MVARVEWHSAGKACSTPARLWFGGERVVVRVTERVCLGPVQAGGAIGEQFFLEDSRGRVFRVRASPGVVVVELLAVS